MHARAYNLGPLGTLLLLDGGNDEDTTAPPPPAFIFVVDRSGSMGSLAPLVVNRVLPDLMMAQHAATATIIMFDSQTEWGHDARADHLRTLAAHARGRTTMEPAVCALSDALLRVPRRRSAHVVVVSDGLVDDAEDVVRRATKLAPLHTGANTAVTLVRFMSGRGSTPDTRALACLGLFNTAPGRVDVLDVHTHLSCDDIPASNTGRVLLDALSHALAARGLRDGGVRELCVADARSTRCLRRGPADAPEQCLRVPRGRASFALVTATDTAAVLRQLLCDNQPLRVTVCDAPESEAELADFLRFVESQTRLHCVAGGATAASRLHDTLAWCRGLQQLLERTATAARERLALAGAGTNAVAMVERVRRAVARARVQHTSVLRRLLQLENADRVHALNAAQQADFLRATIRSAATARRALKTDATLDYDALCRAAVRRLAESIGPLRDDGCVEAEHVSYVSHADWRDALRVAVDELAPHADALTSMGAADIMPLLGGLGVAFRGTRGDLPDPWQFRVYDVYADAMYLSECDLASMLAVAADRQPVFPGRGANAHVTGVMPLRALDADAYDEYACGACRELAELHASLAMRGALARVPYDCLARDCAVLLALHEQVGDGARAPTTCEAWLLGVLTDQLRRAVSSYTSLEALGDTLAAAEYGTGDVRTALTGVNGVSATLKPYAVLLTSDACEPLRQRAAAGDVAARNAVHTICHALYGFECYLAARRHFKTADDGGAARRAQLHALLRYDAARVAKNTPVGEPFTEDPSPLLWDDPTVCTDESLLPTWLPALSGRHDAVLRALGCSNNDEAHALWRRVMRVSCAAEALQCTHETERFEDELRVAHLADVWSAQAYLLYTMKRLVHEDVTRRLDEKRAAERRIRQQRIVAAMCKCQDYAVFVALLNDALANRDAPGYVELEAALLQRANDWSPTDTELDDGSATAPALLLLRKLAVLVVARDLETGEPAWCAGNVLRGNVSRFARAFERVEQSTLAGASFWREYVRPLLREHGATHVYRASGKPNRHGHCASKPSWYALGYASLDACRAQCGADEWCRYAALHEHCCGL